MLTVCRKCKKEGKNQNNNKYKPAKYARESTTSSYIPSLVIVFPHRWHFEYLNFINFKFVLYLNAIKLVNDV